MGLPWLKKYNPNTYWREGRVTFNLTRCAKHCLTSSPHATTLSEEKAMGEYYRDTRQDMASQDTVYSISMVNAETFEEEFEDGIEGTMILEYIDEILYAWEVYYADMNAAEPQGQEPVEEPMATDIVPVEYHQYLHIFEQRTTKDSYYTDTMTIRFLYSRGRYHHSRPYRHWTRRGSRH
jgi:hypothetical protein